eukprot:763005_1
MVSRLWLCAAAGCILFNFVAAQSGPAPAPAPAPLTAPAPAPGPALNYLTNPNYCPALTTPSNGFVDVSNISAARGYNDSVVFTCYMGYLLAYSNGSSISATTLTRTCDYSTASNGAWSESTVSCTQIAEYCPNLTDPTNGNIVSEIQYVGGEAVVNCSNGYQLAR